MLQEHSCFKGRPPIISLWSPSWEYGSIQTMNKSEVFFLNEENISHDVVTIFSPRSQGKIVSDT